MPWHTCGDGGWRTTWRVGALLPPCGHLKFPSGSQLPPSHLAGPSILVSETGPLKAPEHVPSAKVPTQ